MTPKYGVGIDEDRGPNVQMYSGKPFYVLDPRPEEVDIEDIAHSLSNQCRYNGHSKVFYSVAQHSVLVSQLCPEKYALEGLLHDATECYIGDIISPMKVVLPEVGKIEQGVWEAVAKKFNLPMQESQPVKEADMKALRIEFRDVVTKPNGCDWAGVRPYTGSFPEISASPPWLAKFDFINRYNQITGENINKLSGNRD